MRVCTVVLLLALPLLVGAQSPTPAQTEFFEKKIRPVLAEKCYSCHNSKMKTPLGGLRLDTRAGVLKGGDSGPAIVPGDPAQSRLNRALSYQHELKMPPTGKLSDAQIADFAAWVKDGAPDPRVDQPAPAVTKSYDLTEGRKHWAFQPVRKPAVPFVKNAKWVQSPIDSFILSRLEAKGLQPALSGDKRALLRRITYDLTGLPPTPEEIAAFLNDHSATAFEKVVDRLLASPHYGERWARHWLDLMRYAETNGHEYDNEKYDPWRYRDYVIRAFNDDLPYDWFVREHIAGDLLPSKRLRADGGAWESPLATTALWFNEVLNSTTDPEKARADDVDNQIDVVSKAFLGLTVACARCHDHKFDPIPTADYYALAGVFHSTDLREAVIDGPKRTAQILDLSARIRELGVPSAIEPAKIAYRPADKTFERFESFGNWIPQGAAFGEGPRGGAADSRSAGSDVFVGTLTSPKFGTGKELYLHVRIGGTKGDPSLKERGPLRFTIVNSGFKSQHIVPDGSATPVWKTLTLTFERERTVYFEIVDRSRDGHIIVDEIAFSTSKEPPSTEVPHAEPAPALSADVLAKRAALEAQVPMSAFATVAEDLNPRDVRLHIRGNHKNLGEPVPRRFLQVVAGEKQPPVEQGSGRLHIADWLASADNPLTARVMVNRMWKHHFGAGLVRSADNFGKMGEAPTHPELLDYLAARFVESGWSVKQMHRLMLLSSTYQMSSAASEESKKIDPTNALLQHMPVRRLEAEVIRDTMLAVSGSLDRTLFGPSIVPYISNWQEGRGKPKSGPLDGNGRRSIYIQVRRNFMVPMFLAFDYPVPTSAIGARTVSTVPSQALLMMNNEFVYQQAARWAAQALKNSDPEARVQSMYEAAYARRATAGEIANIMAFVKAQQGRSDEEIWADVAHVLMNSAEFIYVQ